MSRILTLEAKLWWLGLACRFLVSRQFRTLAAHQHRNPTCFFTRLLECAVVWRMEVHGFRSCLGFRELCRDDKDVWRHGNKKCSFNATTLLHTYTCTCVYIYMHTYTYTHICVCKCVYIYTHACIHTYANDVRSKWPGFPGRSLRSLPDPPLAGPTSLRHSPDRLLYGFQKWYGKGYCKII